MSNQTTILITGATGLLGFHVRAALHAHNAAMVYRGEKPEFEVRCLSRREFDSDEIFARRMSGVQAVLHLAGVNRASPEQVEHGNQNIASSLVTAMKTAEVSPHVIYANSTHSESQTPYGIGKKKSADMIRAWSDNAGAEFTDIVLPHLFGEGGVPDYNTVTATLCHKLVTEQKPSIHAGAAVELVHAGDVADLMIQFIHQGSAGRYRMSGKHLTVKELFDILERFKIGYDQHSFPNLSDPFDVKLFNTYRDAEFPVSYPRGLTINKDTRGELFEAVKGGGGGQTFLSWTNPGVERGNHYHRMKVERFLVLSGSAEIRIRRLFDSHIHRFSVAGEKPVVVDMPTLHTHSIINTGTKPLLTLFWAHEVFDQKKPDTYYDTVCH